MYWFYNDEFLLCIISTIYSIKMYEVGKMFRFSTLKLVPDGKMDLVGTFGR